MSKKNKLLYNIDWLTIILYTLLVIMGWLNIYAAVFSEDNSNIFDISQKYGKQLMWIGFASILAIVILFTDSKLFSAFGNVFYIIMIVLLIAVLIFGKEIKGAKSWFDFGLFRLQPSEFAKFATCLAVAKLASRPNLKIHDLNNLIKFAFIIFLPAALIVIQGDAGSALVYVSFVLVLYREGLSGNILFLGLWAAILFVATLIASQFTVLLIIILVCFIFYKLLNGYFSYTIKGLGIITSIFLILLLLDYVLAWKLELSSILNYSVFLSLLPIVGLIYKNKIKYAGVVVVFFLLSIAYTNSVEYIFNNVLEDHQRTRIEELLGIKSDPLGAGYNVNQSKIAIGSGGVSGKGFLKGTQTKYDFVPEQSTDFIFCTVGEEWGFLGTTLVILLFVFLLLRLLYLSERQRSTFSRVYGYGVACILFFHVAINIGMTIGLAPVIGIPLPFFSYGGSSLWSFTILLFIFIRLDANRFETIR